MVRKYVLRDDEVRHFINGRFPDGQLIIRFDAKRVVAATLSLTSF
jgi:hypothetical protein